MIFLLLACAEPEPAVLAPHAQSWPQEAELVVDGLHAVEALWNEGQRGPAGILAERVYTERFEPRMEPAIRKMEGEAVVVEIEYAFSLLRVALDGKDSAKVEASVDGLARTVRAAGEAAERAFPPPGVAPVAEPPRQDVRPIVPEVPPAWEVEEGTAPDAPTEN